MLKTKEKKCLIILLFSLVFYLTLKIPIGEACSFVLNDCPAPCNSSCWYSTCDSAASSTNMLPFSLSLPGCPVGGVIPINQLPFTVNSVTYFTIPTFVASAHCTDHFKLGPVSGCAPPCNGACVDACGNTIFGPVSGCAAPCNGACVDACGNLIFGPACVSPAE